MFSIQSELIKSSILSVTTAKQWARIKGLPVKRPGGGVVRAFPDELDAWQREQG